MQAGNCPSVPNHLAARTCLPPQRQVSGTRKGRPQTPAPSPGLGSKARSFRALLKVAGPLFISFLFLFVVFLLYIKSMNTNRHREKITSGGRLSFGRLASGIPFEDVEFVKPRSRVLRRRTWQAALDKPRVHDGQWGFCYTIALMSVTAENRAFEEKRPLVFFTENSEAW